MRRRPGGMEQKDGAQMLQEEYRALTGCAMTADVRCDRENEVENYTLQCDWNADGSARVEVLAPETLVGIAAEFNGDDLSLHYDDMSLGGGAGQQPGTDSGSDPAYGGGCHSRRLYSGKRDRKHRRRRVLVPGV